MERTCQLNNSWSGSSTSCDIMLCEELQSPSNGFVVLPCNREFQSGCNVRCEDGYYTEGPYTQSCEVSDSGIVQWSTAPVCRGTYVCIFSACTYNIFKSVKITKHLMNHLAPICYMLNVVIHTS